jgi:hypothetical protein
MNHTLVVSVAIYDNSSLPSTFTYLTHLNVSTIYYASIDSIGANQLLFDAIMIGDDSAASREMCKSTKQYKKCILDYSIFVDQK